MQVNLSNPTRMVTGGVGLHGKNLDGVATTQRFLGIFFPENYLGKMKPFLRSIVFRWVGSTTNL